MNELDIIRLREELTRDLEAITRVEAMLKRDDGKINSGATSSRVIRDKPSGANTGLKQMVSSIVEDAAPRCFRTREVAEAVIEKGYAFSSPQTAAASVSSALQRLKDAGLVEKRPDGRYVWRGKDSES